MTNHCRKIFAQAIVMGLILSYVQCAYTYEVAVGLGSTADPSATIAMGDRSKWPVVADLCWGPLANFVPIRFLERSQQEAIFNNFKQRRAIAEIPFRQIRWTSSQPHIDWVEGFGLSVPYVFIPGGSAGDQMLTRAELLQAKARFPNKKIIMNAYSWVNNHVHVEYLQDIVDGVCIEYYPHNSRFNIAAHVAPFAEWAYKNDKILMFLMPPLPDEDRFAYYATRFAQIIYEENLDRLPKGWMKSDKFIFSPANFTFGTSKLTYVPEDAENTVLGAVKALLYMRPELDAGPVRSRPDISYINLLLLPE